ncbi:flagellum-specific peptidoglycan hydrolase FlgJ [Neolewinella xylanilytica]|uniref:Flagellum-specific peptidoglycan hydrolase FlgJ n=1 Tax=Neolewinella xylanilytica TaxID=1514080 RepID=A0A2S6I279_9BACT|nr:glucosaminidase domain-containing protein [Neolewinella xylanilytica]PPK85191.1 flagellum-specific peptidoglycan hydrolase FlgJ [Neolewinella xylanilytica]
MKHSLTRLTAFVGRHWLRLGLIGCALFLLSQKQVNFNVKLGHPDGSEPVPALSPESPTVPAPTDAPVTYYTDEGGAAVRSGGFFSRFNFFGGDEPDLFDRLTGVPDAEVEAFLTRFAHVAQAEQEKFGIPASVILATGLLYSRGGQSAPVRELNNYFYLSCGADWQGATGQSEGQCLRRYESAWTSFRDFSLTLTGGEFSQLAQFGPRDYRRWSAGMQELGLLGNDRLASEIQRTIDRYQLFRFD